MLLDSQTSPSRQTYRRSENLVKKKHRKTHLHGESADFIQPQKITHKTTPFWSLCGKPWPHPSLTPMYRQGSPALPQEPGDCVMQPTIYGPCLVRIRCNLQRITNGEPISPPWEPCYCQMFLGQICARVWASMYINPSVYESMLFIIIPKPAGSRQKISFYPSWQVGQGLCLPILSPW